MDTETMPQADEETESGDVLLDFSDVVERQKVAAPNGKHLQVRTLDDFGLLEEHELQSMRRRFMLLQDKAKLSPVERKEFVALLGDLFDRVTIGDDETKASLNDRQKQRVILVFTATQLGEDSELTQKAILKGKGAEEGSILES